MASAAAGRSAQTINSMYFKPMLRKGYHRKSGSPDTMKMNGGEEFGHKGAATAGGNNSDSGSWWVRDDRTGIYYPKGQEKVMQDIPHGAAKDFGTINWLD